MRYVVKVMANNQAVGVFDSGVGGLSVLQAIHQLLPNENLLYLADTQYVPYGEKEAEFIVERCIKITDYFIGQSVKAIVIACNTATAAAATILREKYPNLPIIAMEPAVKPATQATRSGKVGVLATSGTLKSAKFAALLDRFANDIMVYAQPCPGLVELIEAGDLQGEQTRQLLKSYLQPMLENDCDTIILGCTHYPFLRPLLADLLPASIQIIDTGEAVARHLQKILIQSASQALSANKPSIKLTATGDLNGFKTTLTHLWQGEITAIEALVL